MIERRTVSRVIFNILKYGILAAFSLMCILPVWHVLMASVSNPRLLMGSSGLLLSPLGKVTFEGYRLVFQNSSILIGYGNTILYVVALAAASMLTAIAGYLISRKDFKLVKPLTLLIM